MSYAIVFSSKTGNTKLLADTLHACLPQENCCYFGTVICRYLLLILFHIQTSNLTDHAAFLLYEILHQLTQPAHPKH